MTFIQARPPSSLSRLLTPGHTLLLIDAGLADLDILISGLTPGVVPFVVQPDQDVLEALEAALASASSFETLALVAHGKPGEVVIGRDALTRASLERRSTRWAALASHGFDSIHLFACHAGQDQAFVDGLSSITGCPVAAAATTIGHSSLGAVWQLDVSSTACFGSAEAKPANSLVPFTRASQASWVHELATYYVGTPTSGNGDGSSGNPWNQAGFDAVSGSTTGDTLSIASGFTLTTTASKVAGGTVTGAGSLALTGYTNQDIHLVSPGGTLSITTAAGASLTSANLPGLVNSLVLGGAATAHAGIFSRDPSVGQLGGDGVNLNVNGQTLSISNWTGQRVNGLIRGSGTDGTVNVTAANGFTGGLWRLGNADSLTIPQGASGALAGTLPNLATNGFVINGTVRTLSPAEAASMAAYINGTGTLNLTGYTVEDLSGLTNITTVNVTTATGAVLDSTKLAPVDSITIGAGTVSGTATAIDTLGDSKIIVNSGATLNISGFTTQTLGGMTNSGTINVTTANGAVVDATNLADATSITIGSGTTATATATAIDTLGPSKFTVTGATLNISDTAANLAASTPAALTLGTSVAVTGTTATAADLNTIDSKISVALNASSVTSLTGTAADVIAAYASNTAGTISGLGNEAVTLSDTSLAASLLNSVNSKTTGLVNASSVTTLSGTAADVKSAYTANGAGEISGLGDEAITLSGSTTVADANSVDSSTSGVITATITETGISTLSGLTGTGNAYTISVNDASVDAAALNTLDAKTTVNVNAGSVGTLTGTAAAIDTAINAGTIDTGAAVAVNINSGTATVAQANSIDAQTTGVVTATISDTAISTLNGLMGGSANAYAVTVNDASVMAYDLNILDSKTTVTVNASAVGTLTGYASSIAVAINASTIDTAAAVNATVTLLSATVAQANSIDAQTSGVVTATISEGDLTTLAGLTGTGNAYSVLLTDTTAAASDLNILDGKTTVAVNAASITTLTGTTADALTAYNSSGLTGLGNEAVTISDATLAATDLNALDAKTSGTINASTVTTLSGAAADVKTTYASTQISGLGNEAVTLSGSTSVADANSLDGSTTGAITATITETAISSLSGLTGTGNAYTILVTDASVDAGALNTLDGKTTVNVNAGSVGTLTGSAADIATAISANTIDTAAAVIATVTGTATVAQVNTIDNNTTGVVTATISDHDISTLAGLNNSSGNAYTISVTDASVDAAALNTLDGKTTVNVNAGSVGTLTGTAAAIDTAINASTIDTGSALVVNVNSGSATVAQANSIDAQTTGVVTATISQGDLTTLATLTGTGNAYTVTLSDTTAAASALTTLDGKTTVAVNAGSVTTLSGTAAEVTAAYSANTAGSISGLGDEAVTLSDATLAATALNTVNSNTTGVVNATSVTTLTGLLADVNTAYAANAANTISGLGDEAVTITNGTGTLLASDLSTAGNATTGTVTVTNTQTVAGTVAEVTAALVTASTKVVMGTASAASISDAATAAQGAPIATTANVTANFSLGIVDSLANLASSGTISSNLSSITADQPAVVLTINNAGGGTMAAADLSAVGNASTGTVTVTNAQTVNGTADEVIAAGVTTASKVNLNTASTLNASTYTTQDLSGVDAAFTLNVTTINGAVLDASKLATADSVTLAGINTATAADADSLGSRLTGTATLNISTDPITSSTDLSDLGSGLTLQFGGDTSLMVTGATLSVRQDQVSGYTISGTGTVSAVGTTSADTFDASGISATINFTSFSGNDSISIAPSTLGSGDSIDGGSNTDTLIFSAATTSIVDASFTNVTNTEVLQLSAGTNTISLGSEADNSGAGITTVTGNTGADTLNVLYGTTGLTFNAGSGSDTLSYNADSATQSITLTSVSSGIASGSVSNGGTDTFTGLEAIVGGSGSSDLITSTIAAETLLVTGVNAGTIDGFAFNGVESVNLGLGNDSATINSGGSLSGNLDLGAGSDSLSYASYSSAVSATLSGANALSSTTAISSGVSGVENVTLSSNNDTFTVANGGTLGGTLDLGSGSDTLSYSGYSSAVSVSLSSATSASSATGISGSVTGFESLVGGSGTDTLNATSGVNNLNVASGGITTLDSSLTVSGFETINLGANSDSSSDTASISGAFSGTVDLGAGNDTATINDGGSFTSLVGGGGTDTLNLDGANNSITVTATGAGTTAGTTGSTTTFSGFETLSGQDGNDAFTVNSASSSTISLDGGAGTDSLSADGASYNLLINGTGSGSLGNVTFSGMESITLGGGADTATVASGGSITGALAMGSGTDTLSYAGYGSAVSVTLSGGTVLSSTTAIGGGVSGVNGVTLSSNNDTFTVANGGALNGNLDLGSGSDTLSYSGYSSAVTVSLNSATSTAAGGASQIYGTVIGFESLAGGSGSDTLNANAGVNTLNVASDGTTTLDTSLTVSGFETIKLGANSDASNDTTTISGAFSGTIDLGAGNDIATINSGGSLTSLMGGVGTDTLNLDGANQTITVTGTGNGTTLSSSGGTTTFSGFETVNGLAGDDGFTVNSATSTTISLAGGNGTDSLSVGSDTAANSLTISGAGSGTLGSVTFSGMESIALGSGNDTATVNSGGSLSGNLNLGNGNNTLTFNSGASTIDSVTSGTGNDTVTISAGSISGALDLGAATDTLSYAGYSSAVSATLSGANVLSSSSTAIGGGVTGVENITLSSNHDTFTVANGGTLGGNLDLGSGSDTLSYAGYSSAVSVSLNSATSASSATGISGSVSGLESLLGGSASDTLNANAGVNNLNVTSVGTTTLDSSLTVSGFETINLGANSDSSADTATISGAFSGTVDLGDGNDTATITDGGSVTNLVGGAGTDTLNLDGANNSTTVTAAGAGTTAGTTGGTTTFSGFETLSGQGGNDAFTVNSASSSTISLDGGAGSDSLSVAGTDSAANSLTISGSGSGSLGSVSFSAMESIALASGGDTATVSSGGLLSGNLDLGAGDNSLTFNSGAGSVGSVTTGMGTDSVTISGGSISGVLDLGTGSDSLSYAGYGSAVSATLSGANALSSTTAISGGVTGVENVTLSSNNDTFTVANGGTLSGNLDLGSGSDTLSYLGYSSAVSVSLSGATSASSATGISGSVTGVDRLVGGSGSDTLNATAGVNSLTVAADGTTTLDSSLTVSGFETFNLGANSDSSSDTATFSGAFAGSVDLGAGNAAAMINAGGSVTNLAGGSGSDTLNFDAANNNVTVSGSGNGTDGTTSFSSFETLNLAGGNDTATVNAVASTTITIDGGAGSDTLQVASTDTANNSLTLSGVGGGVLGNVTFLNQEAVSLGSGGDTVLLANGSSLAGNLNLGGGSNSLQIGQVGTGLTSDQATFWTTTDNYSETYLNGTLVGSTTDWGSPFSFNFTGKLVSGNNVIAVASHDAGGIAGMQAQLLGAGNTVLLGSSNPGWKFSLSAPSGWQNASFDDSSWSSPIAKTQTSSPWGNKMPVNDGSAGWIWSADPNGDDNVYFRYSFNYIPPGSSQSGAVSLGSLSGGSGADTVSLINGTVSGAYNAGDGTNTLTISGSASSVGSYQGGSDGDTVNLSGGDITGDVFTGAGDDRLVLADPGSSVTGAVDFGSGSADTLSYAGNSAAAAVTLSGANSIAAAGATGIGGSVSGFEVLVGGNGSDSLTAQAGSNSFTVSSGGVANLDSSLTLSGFETINLGAGVDTANLQGSFSGALDLGAGTDTVTLESGGSAGNIAGGSEADTLNFNASANSVSFGASGSGSGQSTTFTGFETVNLLGGNDSASFNGAFAGSVELGDGNDTATINTGGSTTSLSGGAGTDTLNANSAANSLSLSGADAGSVDGTAFNSFEAINLAAGNDTVTVAAGGSLSGNFNLGDDSNSLTLQAGAGSLASVTGGTGSDTVLLQGGSITGALNAGDGSNSLTVSGSNASVGSYQGGSGNDAITLSGGTIFGNVDLGSGANSLLISSTNSGIGGSVSFGSGSADALSYAGYGTALNLTLNTATSLAASQAPGVMGAVSGFENLTGTSGSDSINAASGSNTLVVAAGGSTSLDGLNLNSFESINLGANSDASADSVTLSGSFSGSIDLGAGNDTGTINGGGASSLAGGSGSDTLNFNAANNSVTVTGSGDGSDGSTSFSGFETLNLAGGDDTTTLNAASSTTMGIDGGTGTDSLNVANSDTSNNSLTLTDSGSGTLGNVTYTTTESVSLGSGNDTVVASGRAAGQQGSSGGATYVVDPVQTLVISDDSSVNTQSTGSRASSISLDQGVWYKFVVSGTWTPDRGYGYPSGTWLADAKYVSRNNWSTASDLDAQWGNAEFGLSSNLLGGGNDDFWGAYNSSHIYQYEFLGTGVAADFYVNDSLQPNADDKGRLDIKIYRESPDFLKTLNLGAGDDTITFQSGALGVGTLSGGAGTDVLNYASYGSGVSVNLASGTATGTSGISGFERVIGSSANDTLIASTSDANLLVGNDGNDSFGFTISGLTSADTVQGGAGRDTLVFSTAGTINESQFSNVSSVEQVALNGASSFNLGTASQTVGVDTVLTGSGTTTVSTTIADYDLAVDANGLANNTSVTLSGSSASNDFVVSSLKGDLVASSTSGSLSVTTADNTVDNTISITIGTGATTITGGAGGDTLSIDTGLAAENSSLTLAGSSNQSLTNLVADISATTLSGSLTVTASDATDNGISIATGSNNTTINASGTGDSVTVNANAMADNTTLTLNGSATETVSYLQANTNASGSSAAVNLSYKDVADNAASISTGSAATTVSGSSNTDTLTINAYGLTQNTTLTQSGAANQTVTNLVGDINATNLSGTLNVTTGDAADNGISIATGSNSTTINASGTGDTVTVNANAMADNTTLTINGSAAETVSNLQANANASGSSGAVNLSYNDVADNAATITTGSGASTVSGSSNTDTLNVNAYVLGQNTSLTLTGSSQDVVTNLVGDLNATNLSGSLTVTTGDAGDNGIAITTGSANTTINASGSGDTVTVNANVMADNTTLTINGSAAETVSNLQANANVSGTSGAVTLSYNDVADNAATITTGSGATTVSGSSSTDTLNLNAYVLAQNTTLTESGSANQVVTNLVGDISATNLSGTLNVTTGDAADNGISIATGSGATTINASGSGDTVNTNASALVQDTSLTLTGTAKQTVTNLVGDVAATNSSGTLTITTADAGNNGISIATGSNNAYINGTASSDTLSINAAAMAQSSSVNLQGNSAAAVTNLVGDLNGYVTTSALTTEPFNSAAGWTNGTIYSGSSYYGNVLGLYANGSKTNGQDTFKTFDLGGQATNLSFDFARIDSWDGEYFRAYVDDVVAFEKTFQGYNSSTSIPSASGSTNGYSWTIAPKDSVGYYAGVSGWADQTATITIAIPAGKYNTKIGFGSTLDQPTGDESYAIDNLTVPASSIAILSGPLTVTTGDAADNAINIVTGSGATTINASGTGDTVTVNADAMGDNTSLTLTGSAAETVNNLQANTNASASSGVVNLNYKDVADNAANISTGSGATTVSSSTSGDTLSIDAAALAQNTSLTLTGSSQDVVTNLVGDLNATSLSGSLNVTTADAGDQGIAITTGSANTTITASGAADTVTVNANAMADNTTLTLTGSAAETVSNLQAHTNASGTSGAVNLSFKDVADNSATISTGSGATTVSGSSGTDTLSLNATALAQNTSLTESGSANQVVSGLVGDISATNLSGTLNVTTGDAGDNGIRIATGSNNTTINASGAGDTITVDGNAMADNTTLTLTGSAVETVSNLQANTNAAATSGAVSLSYKDVADNAATITTGSGATTVGGSSSTDSLTVDAGNLPQNRLLSLFGAAKQVVNNLVGNLTGANASLTTLSGSLTVNAGDALDNGITITTGTGDTTINASGAGDTITVDGNVMADNTTLTLTGSATETVENLQANTDASASTGALSVSYSTIDDKTANLRVGTGNVVVSGGVEGDQVLVSGLNRNGQSFYGLDANSNLSITAGAAINAVVAEVGGRDQLGASAGSDTLSFAGGSNVVLSISDYGNQAGVVSGQGTDQFSRIESLVGATGTDVLRGTQGDISTEEVLTITGTNSGTLSDAAGTGSFSFSSFEQTDLAAGNDVLRITGSGLITGTADGGAGSDLLDYSAYSASGVVVDLSTGQATAINLDAAGGLVATALGTSSFENVTGSSADDRIVGDGGANLLLAGDGNDSIDGGAGSDTLNGGNGNDLIEGGTGDDLIIASWGNDTIHGSGGATGSPNPIGEVDRVSYAELGVGFDVNLSGVDGAILKLDNNASLTADQIIGSYQPLSQTLSAPTNQVSTDYTQVLSGIQQIVLSNFNDVVRIHGADYLTGRGNASGGSSTEQSLNLPLSSAGSSLTLDGGAGDLDVLDYSSFDASSPVDVNLSSSSYQFDVNSNGIEEPKMGDITLVNSNAASHINVATGSNAEGGANGISGFEVVIGGGGDDAIVGNDANNILVGNGGNNRLAGGAGNDTIFGGTGNDFITPGSGTDLVMPGGGINTILATSDDMDNDQFILNKRALNFVKLQGNGSDKLYENEFKSNVFDPGSMGINILTGGDPVTNNGVTTYDSMQGTNVDDTYDFTATVLKNIEAINMGTGDDVVFTSPTVKGVTIVYDGGGQKVSDTINLNFTFADFRKLNQGGRYTLDLQPYLDNPFSNVLESTSLDIKATGFEKATIAVVAPGIYNTLPGDPAAITFNTVFGINETTITSGDALTLSGSAVATSGADASSAKDIVSAFVQANEVMGANKVTLDAGTDLSGGSSASNKATATAITGDDRSDTVLSAYATGANLSDFNAGRNITLNLSGSSDAVAKAKTIGYLANAASTVDVVGSSDSSLTAGQNLTLIAQGLATQDVQASNVQGVSLATLASRSAGITDPNLPGSSADGLTAGQTLNLTAKAAATNSVLSQGTTVDQIGTFNLVGSGTAAANDYLQSSQVGDQFPLINGDRIRFSTAGGGVLADQDYWVINRNAFTGTFQISALPGGEPVEITADAAMGAYRPADALADALASSTAVQLSRTGVGNEALQAGSGLGLNANASQVLTISASSVDGAAAAGLNRVGSFEGMDMATRSLVVAQQSTSAAAAGPASLDLTASLRAGLEARTVADRADSEANAAVVASDSSSTIAGQSLTIKAAASHSLSSTATSTDGSAQARSGAGAGAGIDFAVDSVPDAISAQGGSYGASKGLVNASQQAGGNLAITATASSEQRAVATTVGGSRTLDAASASSAGYLLIPNNGLADGDPIRLSAAGGTLLSTSTTYRAGSLGFTVELDPTGGPTNKLTSNSGISYSPGDAIRFRLNSNTAHNDGNDASGRSGITFGTTYYVLGGGTSFEVATSVGGSPVTLTPDTIGSPDTLLDADRIRVLEPMGSGQVYRQAAISNSTATILAPITLLQPSAAIALAGGRDADTVLNLADATNSAMVSGIDGQADQAGTILPGTIRSLTAGEDASLSGLANGVVTAAATNTAGAAIASGSQVADGLKDIAITAGSDGTITARGTLSGTVDAITVGMPDQSADALANLNLSATGVAQTIAAESIRIGANGDVQASASLAGRSTASTVTGNSDALATLQADALQLDAANTIRIGDQGNVNASASVGSGIDPLLVSALSSGVGNATSQMGLEVSGILGNSTTPTNFSSITFGGGSLGTVDAKAQSAVDLRASATNGTSSTTLGNTIGGSGNITGIRNTDMSIGADLAKINVTASGLSNLSSISVSGNASATVASSSFGILSDTGSPVGITVADQGQIAVLANQQSVSSATSVAGQATSSLSNSSVALNSVLVNVGANGQLRAEAVSNLLNRAESVSGSANA